MVGKNNNYIKESRSNEHFQRFSLRKLSVGVVSVAVAAGFYLGSGATAQASTVESDASVKTEQVVQQDSSSTSASNPNSASAVVSEASAAPVSATSASSEAVSASSSAVSAAPESQSSAASANEESSQVASAANSANSTSEPAASSAAKSTQPASEVNSQSAANTQTMQLPTSAASANENQSAKMLNIQAVQQAANEQAPAGFTVQDPTYPSSMYQDPDATHYTYWWAQSSDGQYNLVLSTDRNGDGKVYVFLLDSSNKVLGQYTVDKNKSTEIETDDYYFGRVYNDGQSGVFKSNGWWKSKFNVFDQNAAADTNNYNLISFMIPQVETQTTTYVDGNGKQVSDSVVQKGLDGQTYMTTGGKVINGYFAKEPSNATGYMSPFGKQGVTYTKDWHDGTKAEFTEIDTATGLMHVKVFSYSRWFGRWEQVDEFDLAYGESKKVGNTTIHSIYIPQTINIQYIYEKLGNLVISSDSKAFPAEDKTTTQYPNDVSDSTKAGNVTIPKVVGFTPTINGKTVTNYTFNPSDYVSDLSKDINVVYVADTQEAQALFYDETTGQLIDGTRQVATGKTGEAISFTKDPSEIVKELESKGYVFDQSNTKNNVFTDGATYDNDSTVHQYFRYYFNHGMTHTDTNSNQADQKTVSETIHYVYNDGKTAAADYNTTVTFKRGYTTDNVTGKIVSYDPWTVDGKQADSKTFDAVKSPVIAGYTADQAEVAAQTVKPDSQNIVKTVYYTADTQEAAINFFDETDGKLLDNETIHLTGKTGEKISHTEADQTLAKLEKQGYVLDQSTFSDDATYDNNTQAPQEFTIYLKHGTKDTSDSDQNTKTTATRTINVTTPDGKTTSESQKVNYKRTATLDLVTNKTTYGQWQADGTSEWAEYTPTAEKGYTTLIDGKAGTKVAAKTPTFKDEKPVDETVNVTYQADQQFAHTVYIDTDENNAHVPSTPGGSLPDGTVIQNVEIKGATGEKIDYAFDAAYDQNFTAISKYYNVKSVDVPATFDNDDDNDQVVYVYLTHKHATVTPEQDPQNGQKTVTQTIKYQYADGTATALDDNVQALTFKRTGDKDLVTGKVTWPDWSTVAAQQTKAVVSPTIKGYTADQAEVAAQTVTPESHDVVKTVNYTADTQDAAINFYDETDHKLLDNQTIHLTGKTGEKVDRTQAEKTLAELEKQGYVLDEENTAKAFPADAVYDNDDQTPQEFTIYLKHGTTHTDATSSKADQKIVNETIHYVYKDGVNAGKPAAKDYTTAVDFKRGYTTDNVTGKIVSYDDWTQTTKTFDAVKSPVIAGYTADQAEVAAQTVTPESQDVVKTVNYTADTQDAAINFYDETDHKLLDNQTIHLTGKTGEKVDRTQAEKTLAELEKQGYVLDKENTDKAFPTDAVYDNDDQTPQEFTIYLKHGTTHTDATSSKADQKIVNETIHYVYKDGVNAGKSAAKDYTTAVDFKRGYTTDNVTGKIVSYDDWTQTTKTFDAVKSPVIAGYTADQAEVAAQTVTPESQDVVKTVNYTANAQEAAINFYDETDHKLLDNQTIHLTGKTGEKVDRTQAEKTLAELEKQGYVLDEENTDKAFPADAVYDNDDQTPQEFTIYLKHGTTHTDATSSKADQKIVNETIHYVYKDGINAGKPAAKDYTTAVDFKRGYTTDNVTGKIVSYDDWTQTTKTFDAVKSPVIAGYTADQAEVAAQTVTPESEDVVKTVNYTADAQEAQAIFYDETTGKEINGTREIATGKSDEAINFTKDPSEIVKELEAKGYVFDKSNANNNVFVDGTTYDKNSEVHQYFKYYFTHGHATVTPEQDPQNGQKTVTQTIKYQYADGTATGLADNVQSLTFKRTGDKDLVTGKVTWPDWSTVAAQQTESTVSPAIKGYTADTSEIPAVTYHAGDSDVTYVVKYSADAQHAVINYIDGESGEVLHTDKVDGHSDEKINYSTADMIKQLEAKGYELAKDNFPAGEKFDNDDATDQTYTVIFRHHRENVDPSHTSADGTKGTKTLTETVHYKYADGTKAANDQTAQVTFTRNGVLDDVTGIVTWGKWNENSLSYDALTSPTIAGYTPSETVVKRSSNSDAEQGPQVTVVYTADAQTAHVQYIDGESGNVLRQDDLHGYTGEEIPYSTAEGIKKFEGDGYELYKDNFPAGEKFDSDDATDQTYTVIFKHHRENVDPSHTSADGTKGTKTLTETVHYKYADGTKAANDQTAQVTFTRNGVLDDVTGIVAWGKWNENSLSYKALTSPTIAGYTPSETVVKRSSNSDAEQGPQVTVVYTADAQMAYVKYIDDTTGNTLRQDDLHGYTDETIPYSTAEGIKKFEGDGYVLVSDDFKPGTKFGVGTPTYEVHFKHGTTHVDATSPKADQKIVSETIHYVYENNKTAAKDYTSAVDFKRGYTVDNVTGKIISYDPWTQASKTFGAVTSPTIEGYMPNHKQIDAIDVTPDSKDVVKTVVYVGDPQEAQAIFYDETTGKEIANTREIATGVTDGTISFTKDPNEVVKELEKQGYVFDKGNANNNVFVDGTTYDKNSEVHQYFKYYFTHATTIVTPDNPKTPSDVLPDNPGKHYPEGVAKEDLNKTITRTINITTPDGKTQTITQKAEFTRSATVDEVTGEVTYGPWSKNVVMDSVDVPNIPGYVPSATVPEITVTPNDHDMTINITYKKLDSGKTDQNGNASNGSQGTNGGSTTGQAVQNGQSSQTQNSGNVQNAQQLPQTGNANDEKGVLGLASAMFAAGLGLGFGSRKKRHED